MTTQNIPDQNTAIVAAREYITLGFQPVPIPHGEKGPRLKGWPDLRLTMDDLPEHFRNGNGIGLLCGGPSGGLTDIDLDAEEALRLADEFLPVTGMVHGRKSKPRSHRWYKTSHL